MTDKLKPFDDIFQTLEDMQTFPGWQPYGLSQAAPPEDRPRRVWFQKKTIKGCDARGDGDSAYLTRWTLMETRWGKLNLHLFHRSDADEMHDHPWAFWTLILRHGYIEHTPTGQRRLRPGRVLYRPAEWVHRVELLPGRQALTLVWVTKPRRDWGFWTARGWQHWREYFRENGCKT